MIFKSSVPTVRYLRKYVHWRESIPIGGALELGGYGAIPLVLGGLLEGKIKADPRPGLKYKEYDDAILFVLNERRISGTRRVFLTPENIHFFNAFLKNNLREYLLDLVAKSRLSGINEADTIHRFMVELDICDDISFDALKKGLQRHRAAKKRV